MEIMASVVIAIECLLFLLKVIRPSFWFYMSIRKSFETITCKEPAEFVSVKLVYPDTVASSNYCQSNSYHSFRSPQRT